MDSQAVGVCQEGDRIRSNNRVVNGGPVRCNNGYVDRVWNYVRDLRTNTAGWMSGCFSRVS